MCIRDRTDAGLVAGATPVQWGQIKMRIAGLGTNNGRGNRMYFTRSGNGVDTNNNTNVVPYHPAVHPLDNSLVDVGGVPTAGESLVYEVAVRVKVCDASVGLEDNCVAYPSGYYKPEGLIQEYSNRILYSIFGYQNVDGSGVDGGILRANQKFVGPNSYYPENGPQANANREWDPQTGVLFQNPDAADATATSNVVGAGACALAGGCTVRNSGVINYLNKFGQMETGKPIKSHDNVSELYYTAIRYFKNLGNVPAYSTLGGGSVLARYQRADGFPVITNWQDPIRYQCQTNVILGIGDTNTHYEDVYKRQRQWCGLRIWCPVECLDHAGRVRWDGASGQSGESANTSVCQPCDQRQQ